MFTWTVFTLFMFLMVTTTPWLLVSNWSKLCAVLIGIILPHQNKKCQLPLIFSAKFIPSWTSTLTTILSTITCDHFLLLRAGEFMLCNKEHFDPSCNLALGDFTSHQSPRQSALLDGTHKTVEYWPTTPGGWLFMSHTHHSVCPACAMKSNLTLQQSCPNASEKWPLLMLDNN